ncbi:hypothetical protein [Bifidobacterium pullorum]|nr:hypothetical protein [Bifidobacterium pullorum]
MVASLPMVERMPVDRVNGTPANRVRSGIWLAGHHAESDLGR